MSGARSRQPLTPEPEPVPRAPTARRAAQSPERRQAPAWRAAGRLGHAIAVVSASSPSSPSPSRSDRRSRWPWSRPSSRRRAEFFNTLRRSATSRRVPLLLPPSSSIAVYTAPTAPLRRPRDDGAGDDHDRAVGLLGTWSGGRWDRQVVEGWVSRARGRLDRHARLVRGGHAPLRARSRHGLAAIIVTVDYDVGGLVVGRSAAPTGTRCRREPQQDPRGPCRRGAHDLFVGVLIIASCRASSPSRFRQRPQAVPLAILAAPLATWASRW